MSTSQTMPALNEAERTLQRRRQIIGSVIAGSIAVHIAGGLLAGIWVVAKYFTPPPAQFEVRKDLRIPPEERQNKMNMAEHDALTPKPSLDERIASLRPTEFALPDLPTVPMDQMLPLDPASLVSDQVASLVGADGLGAAGEAAGGVGGEEGGFSFFGIESSGRRILLMFDVSTSVVNKAKKSGVPLSEIKARTIELIESFGANTSFTIVQFTRNYNFFQNELVPATDANKVNAKNWVEQEWTEDGMLNAKRKAVIFNPEGILRVLQVGLSLEPDVIFLISDGSFQKGDPDGKNTFGVDIEPREIDKLLKHAAASMGRDVPINFIGFEMKENDRRELRRIFRRTGGTFREIGL